MKQKLKEKREALGRAWDAYKEHRDSLDTDDKKWTSEDREKFEKLDSDVDKLEKEIKSLESKIEREEKDKEREDRFKQTDGDGYREDPNANEGENAEEKRMDLFNRYLERGDKGLTDAEFRDLQSGVDTQAGFLVGPTKFVKEVIADLDNDVIVRSIARTLTIKKAKSLGVIKKTANASSFKWGTEIGTPTRDSSLAYGKRELYPHPCIGEIRISSDLLRSSIYPVDTIVRQELVRDGAELQESAFMTGHGNKQPLGLFTASDDGISTSRDVSTDNTTTAIKADNLIEVQSTLKEAYRKKAKWLFHRDAIKKIRKLKDGNGQYLWTPGLSSREKSQILGDPYVTSDYVPNTWTTGLYVGMYGDFSWYWIVDALDMEIQVLNELYARTSQIGFIARMKTDAAPCKEEAFVRITLG